MRCHEAMNFSTFNCNHGEENSYNDNSNIEALLCIVVDTNHALFPSSAATFGRVTRRSAVVLFLEYSVRKSRPCEQNGFGAWTRADVAKIFPFQIHNNCNKNSFSKEKHPQLIPCTVEKVATRAYAGIPRCSFLPVDGGKTSTLMASNDCIGQKVGASSCYGMIAER
mmetsp:Transcript_17991/g.34040  ORF Transcript_17991/g.34040 Transcript_17991/m.34040 type:complete len:167 (-) Transcript_17991:80-580(-)